MRGLRIALLGEFTVRRDGEPAVTAPRAQALLAYLVVHRGVPLPRRQIAFLFWPDSTEPQARTNLRQTLHMLRRALSGDECLSADGATLSWTPGCGTADVWDFDDALAEARKADASGDEEAARSALSRAGECYGGDLLPDHYDDWVLAERERLRAAFTAVAERLAATALAGGALTEALRWSRRLQRHDPLYEPGYRLLMRAHAAGGDRGAMVKAYEQCVTVLARELGVEPSAETRRLRDRLAAQVPPASGPGHDASAVIPGRSGPLPPPLIGRRAEWTVLHEAWRSVRRGGTSRAVVISGEAGIGKSRLAEDFLAGAAREGRLVASSRAYAAEGSLPFAPVADWLRTPAVRRRLDALGPVFAGEVARLLPELSPGGAETPDPEGWQRIRFFEVLTRAIRGGPDPVILGLDDLQWCDPDTLEWLHYLLRSSAGGSVLLVATLRTEASSEPPLVALLRDLRRSDLLTMIELGPLSSDQTAQLGLRAAERPLAPDEQAELYRATGGVPLLIVASVHASEYHPGPRTALSPRVYAVLDDRLAGLTPATRALAEVAAVIGRGFDPTLLAEAAGSSEADVVAALDELWRHRLLREEPGGYGFAHDLLREAAYAGISPVRRRAVHARIAQVLEPRHAADPAPVLARLAVHHELAGQTAQAVDAYRRAAAVAEHRYAVREVTRLVGRALHLLGQLPQTRDRDERELELRTAAGVALVAERGYGVPEVYAMFGQASALCDRLGRPVDPPILRALAIAKLSNGDLDAAEGFGRQLLDRAASGGDPALSAEAHYVLGVTAFWRGRFEESRAELEEAVAASPVYDHGHLVRYSQDVGAVCLMRLALTLYVLGDVAQARTRAAEARIRAERIAHPYTLAYVLAFGAWLATELGDLTDAREYAATVAAQGPEHGQGFPEPMSRAVLGWTTAVLGDPGRGSEQIAEVVASYATSGQPLLLPYLLSLLARSRLLVGDLAGAEAALEEAAVSAQLTGERFWDAELLRIRGDVAYAAGAPAEGAAFRRRAVHTARLQRAASLASRAASDGASGHAVKP